MELSFREKSIGITVISIFLVYGYYFLTFFNSAETVTAGAFIARMIGVVVVLIVIEVVLNILVGVTNVRSANEYGSTDERDKRVSSQSCRNAYYIICPGALALIVHILAGDLMNDPGALFTPLMSANLLLLIVVIAELVKYCSQLFYYRRGV